MYTLALDCSTARGSVALADTAAPTPCILWQGEFPAGRGHGGALFTALQSALAALPTPPLHEIIVGLGPGSYSGVRQTVAAAIGLSAATGATLTGLPSPCALDTDALAFHTVGDARRSAFYYTPISAHLCLAAPELLPDAVTLHARLAAHPSSWPILAVECSLDLLPPGAIPAWPLAARLLLPPRAARTLPPLEPIYLRPVSITLPTPK